MTTALVFLMLAAAPAQAADAVGDDGAAIMRCGEVSPSRPERSRRRAREVLYLARGGIEAAFNIGQQRYREILIELK